MTDQDKNRRTAWTILAALFLGLALAVAVATWFVIGAIPTEDSAEPMRTVLTNVAAVGGVASGLSLAGYSVVLSNSRGIRALLNRYGGAVRALLIGGYILMVVSAMTCAVVSGLNDYVLNRLIGSVSAGVITSGLITTALVINSMFGWETVGGHLPESPSRSL